MKRRPAADLVACDQQLDLPLFADDEASAATDEAPLRSGAAAAPRLDLEAPRPVPKPPPPMTPPERFEHPQANREIALGRALVRYEFRRARRRSIGMVVGVEGLTVRAPRWVGVAEVEAALREKSTWIQAKLAEQRERARRHAAARIEWRDGASLPFLGETLVLLLDPRIAGARLDAEPAPAGQRALAGVPRRLLRVGLPHTAAPEQIRDLVQSWLQRQARSVFDERCAHYAPQLGVQVRRIALSAAQTRWGSASADGSVRLNWRLIHFALPTIDYVVAHELAHLREMNHSPRFWDVVRSVIPDVEAARVTLRAEVLPALD
ncbi:MAG TPA: SprT family zinc-dependent metalloprotease [Methylibium sp.]|uniref:M48 family metallopeptidase n=1 Tax=Methylibium sp. TaxID=2067992 RepID=UPI002DB97230|nr:SprT family zinc-dependent metalloprotease [Methylibium sp.]HEU4460905.1 SprT family zinc-dependent metalloprotease [Methylibium sp.]